MARETVRGQPVATRGFIEGEFNSTSTMTGCRLVLRTVSNKLSAETQKGAECSNVIQIALGEIANATSDDARHFPRNRARVEAYGGFLACWELSSR